MIFDDSDSPNTVPCLIKRTRKARLSIEIQLIREEVCDELLNKDSRCFKPSSYSIPCDSHEQENECRGSGWDCLEKKMKIVLKLLNYKNNIK